MADLNQLNTALTHCEQAMRENRLLNAWEHMGMAYAYLMDIDSECNDLPTEDIEATQERYASVRKRLLGKSK